MSVQHPLAMFVATEAEPLLVRGQISSDFPAYDPLIMGTCGQSCPTCGKPCLNNVAGHAAGNHLCANEHSW